MATKALADPGKELTQLDGLITGLTTAAPAGLAEIGVGGKSYSIPALVTKLTGYRDTFAAVPKIDKARQVVIEARDAVAFEAGTFLRQVQTAVKGALGKTSAANENYGIKPNKPPVALTAEQLVLRKVRSAATRVARGTIGSKKKKAIKGVVPPAPGAPPPVKPVP